MDELAVGGTGPGHHPVDRLGRVAPLALGGSGVRTRVNHVRENGIGLIRLR